MGHKYSLSMSSAAEQLKILYEQEGMTPDEIAGDQEMDIAAVKACLMSCSGKYRRACGSEEPEEDHLNFTNDQLEAVNRVIYEIAIGAEDDSVRLKAATYLRDDKKGRKEVVKAVGGAQFNILMFNEQMQKIRQLKDAAVHAI